MRLPRRHFVLSSLLGALPAVRAAQPLEPAPRAMAGARAVNLARADYWTSLYPFADLVKSSGPGWTPGTWADAQDWLRGLPPGQSCHCWLVLHLDPVHAMFPAGRYAVGSRSRATLLLKTLDKRFFERVQSGVGQASFTVKPAADGGYGELSVGIECRNDTGAPIDVDDLSCVLLPADERDAAGAPARFHPAWLQTNRGAVLVRTMDWAATNNSGVASVSALPQLSQRTWSGGVPYRVQARAAAALDADLWVTVPHGGENHRYRCERDSHSVTLPEGGGFREGQRVAFVDYGQGRAGLPAPLAYGKVYRAIECDGARFRVADAATGRPIEFASDTASEHYSRVSSALAPAEYAELYERIAQQVREGLGERTRVYVEYSNEVWNGSFLQSAFARQVLSRLAGSAHGSADGYAFGSLLAWRAFERVLGRDRVRRVFCGQAAWFGNLGAALDYRDPGVVQRGATVGRLADVYAVAPYIEPHDARGEPMGLGALLEQGAVRWSDRQWDEAFDRHLQRLSRSLGEHLAQARARGPQMVFTSYECGQHVGGSVPPGVPADAAAALQRRYLEYLNGDAGAAMYRRYHDRVFVRHGLQHFNHYQDAGGYSSSRHVFQWGLKPSHLARENPRSAFVRSLGAHP